MNHKELSENIGKNVLLEGRILRLISAEAGTAKLRSEKKIVYAPTAALRVIPRKMPANGSLEEKPIIIKPIILSFSRKWLQESPRAKQQYGVFKGYARSGSVRVRWEGKNYTETYHPSFLTRAKKLK